jgi:hypothetical protein
MAEVRIIGPICSNVRVPAKCNFSSVRLSVCPNETAIKNTEWILNEFDIVEFHKNVRTRSVLIRIRQSFWKLSRSFEQ